MAVNLIYKAMPTVALRGIVLFPGMSFHFDVGRKKSIAAVKAAMHGNQKIFLVTQKDISDEEPTSDALFDMGVIAEIKQVIKSTDNNFMRVVVEGICRASVSEILQSSPYFITDVKEKKNQKIKAEHTERAKAAVRMTKELFDAYVHLSQRDVDEAVAKVFFTDDAGEVADIVAGNTIPKYEARQELLEDLNPVTRLEKLYALLKEEVEILKCENDLESKVESVMEKNQKEYYLREKIRVISEELGDGEDSLSEIEKYRKKISALSCTDEIRQKLTSECDKLSKMQGNTADATICNLFSISSLVSLPSITTFIKNSPSTFSCLYIKSIAHLHLKKKCIFYTLT